MNNIIELFKKQKEIIPFLNDNSKNSLIVNSTINHNVLLTALKFYETDKSIIYVAYNLYKATYVYETLCDILGVENVNFFVTDEIVAVEALAISNEFKYERMHTINSLINNQKKVVVTYISSFLRPLIDKNIYIENTISLKKGNIIDISQLIKKLVIMGYKRTPSTSQTGDFSVRGEIIDIYPINSNKPYRIDFFDDEIDYIKTFDPLTQKTIEVIDNISIFPINELLYEYNDEIINNIKKDINNFELFEEDIESIKNYSNNEKIYKYIKYIYKNTYNLTDYISNGILILDEYNRINECYEKTIEELNFFLENKKEFQKMNLSFIDDISILLDNDFNKIFLTEFKQSLNNIKLDSIISIDALSIINYQNDIMHLIEDIKISNKTILIVCQKDISKKLLIDNFNLKNLKINDISDIKDIIQKEINICKFDNFISFGFINGIEVITEANIFKVLKFKNSKYRSVYQNTTAISSKEDLKPGDYVVHYDYGIGRYQGIQAVELKGITNDYLSIKFSNTELYVPIERINLIEKYLGSEGSIPTLSTIGTKEWEKKKQKIQQKVESIAQDLINVQAKREKLEGFRYLKDEEIQNQFEADFEYETTIDQQKAIDDIKKDMEEGKIIDRLVCGDVGYGKTEVAIRIAMKTVLNNKQVAFLAPTTILTRQHYQTFLNRFQKYGVRVELINRLISKKDQKRIIEDVKKGLVDILIGTHSLLNDSIIYKDLGLLIVDEEQRFGVTHKEKIKQYKNSINVLTLTATPIPRTLQMSIMGVRQLSLMETPPQNRYPVQTYVIEKNDIVIREAIYREIGRDGQVFYLHNRIEDLDLIYSKLRRLVPDAKIIMAHGQMSKEELEDAIQSFIDKKYDVLLCTTIIETGIDIPNTNTLIVDMADHLGLAQMYQIRGRVGRSTRVSYAYFMFEKNKVLTDASNKRLQAIKEFTTLGSGYKIAVRDLAIRGAGDILGKEQSGFIDTIGLDLYMKMLSDAIDKLKGNKKQQSEEQKYNIQVAKHVNDSYVSDDDIKIYIHKEIKNINNKQEMQKVENELIDRFGKLTEDIKTYIKKQYLESLANKIGIEKIKSDNYMVEISFKPNIEIDAGKLFKIAYKINSNFTFKYISKRIIMTLTNISSNKQWINDVINVIEKYNN